MLRRRVPNSKCSKGKRSAAHFRPDIRHIKEILVGARIFRRELEGMLGAIKSKNVCFLLEL